MLGRFGSMDLQSEEKDGDVETVFRSKLRGFGSFGSKDMFFRADKIDLKSLDIQLEKHLTKAWNKDKDGARRPMEEWEIDLSKLEIRYVVAQGTYGTVYRGNYDCQDVAGIFSFLFQALKFGKI